MLRLGISLVTEPAEDTTTLEAVGPGSGVVGVNADIVGANSGVPCSPALRGAVLCGRRCGVTPPPRGASGRGVLSPFPEDGGREFGEGELPSVGGKGKIKGMRIRGSREPFGNVDKKKKWTLKRRVGGNTLASSPDQAALLFCGVAGGWGPGYREAVDTRTWR